MTIWDEELRKRKQGHVDACLNKDVAFRKTTGFERYDFVHNALPELNFKDVDTSTTFLGKKISMPLIISGMTGGPKLSKKINRNLAIAAEKCKVAMGVGSERIAIEQEKMRKSFDVREQAPSIPLLANLGAVQLGNGFGVEECRKAIDIIKGDALVLHLNPIQEVIQQGDTNHEHLLKKMIHVVINLGKPVIVKEVGFGISGRVGDTLASTGVYGIDVSGAGGTSWSAVESHLTKGHHSRLGKTFWDWGIPTSECIRMNRDLKIKIIAGGGIRNGLDMAKAIALGADYVSVAGPLLKAAMDSPKKVIEELMQLQLELKTAMFGIGAKSIAHLKNTKSLTLRF